MEVIALILFIVFTVLSFNGKGKKQGSQAKVTGQAKVASQAKAAGQVKAAGQAKAVGRAAMARGVSAAGSAIKQAAGLQRPENRAFEDALSELRQRLERDTAANGTQGRPATAAAFQATHRLDAAEGSAMLDDAECRGGSMAHIHTEGRSTLEDEDCYGGSMEHTHDEGVSRSAHARRMAAMDAGRDDGTQPHGVLPGQIDANALRRAVVMAEVLGKPRALQARRR